MAARRKLTAEFKAKVVLERTGIYLIEMVNDLYHRLSSHYRLVSFPTGLLLKRHYLY